MNLSKKISQIKSKNSNSYFATVFYCTGLAMCGYKNTDYLQLLRDEIEEFRVLFAEWVKTFDQWNYLIDRWGLFNPPGIDYDTHDPDDDIPFDTNDFSDF